MHIFGFPVAELLVFVQKGFFPLLFVHVGVSVKSPVFSTGILELEKLRGIEKVKALDSRLLSI